MNFLKQVISLFSRYDTRFDFFNEEESQNTAFHRLYAGVQNGQYSTDEDAASDIYRISSPDARYRNLKSRLKKKLLNQLFFLHIEPPQYSESLAARYEAERLLFSMKILGALGANQAAYEIAIQVLSISEKFHLTKIAVDSLEILRSHAAFTGNSKDFAKFAAMLSQYTDTMVAELKAAGLLQQFNLYFTASKSIEPTTSRELAIAAKAINALWQQYKSFTLFLYNLRIHTYLNQAGGDYEASLKICDEGELFLEINPHLSTAARMFELSIYKSSSLLYLRRYNEGIIYLESRLPSLPEGSTNWFELMWTYFQFLFHSNDLTRAKELHQKVTTHIGFDTGPTYRTEAWQIFDLYLTFVEGKETPDMDRFMKDMEVYKADKSGVYVAVFALSILVLLRKGEYDSIITRDEYLKKYLTRYLRGDDHVRSAAFFRLLRLLVKHDFDLEAVKAHGEKHLAVLYDASIRLDDYEVMPYERMWEYVVEILSKNQTGK